MSTLRKPLALLSYGSATIGKLFLYFSTSRGRVLTGCVLDRFGKGIMHCPVQRGRKGHPVLVGTDFGAHQKWMLTCAHLY